MLLCAAVIVDHEVAEEEHAGVPEEQYREPEYHEQEPQEPYREQDLPEGYEDGKFNWLLWCIFNLDL